MYQTKEYTMMWHVSATIVDPRLSKPHLSELSIIQIEFHMQQLFITNKHEKLCAHDVNSINMNRKKLCLYAHR